MQLKNIASFLLFAFLFTGCEKVVNLQYKGNQSGIVIEGNISNDAGPYFVKITKSIPLSETGLYPPVDNAIVVISDDAGNSETLTALGNGLYSTADTDGVEGRTYTLTVQAEAKTYTAQSTMPQRVFFDSIKVEKLLVTGDTVFNLIPVYNDPVSRGNNYRFILTHNSKLISQHLVLNDEIKNGLVNTLKLEIDDDNLELKTGDSIRVKMQCIDKKVALYYTTLALMADSGPGGGTTPNNPPNNISNGALGIFSAHTMQEQTKVLQ